MASRPPEGSRPPGEGREGEAGAGPPVERVRVCLVGEQSLLARCGDALLDAGYEIVGVVAASGDAAAWALDRRLKALGPEDAFSSGLAALGEFEWLLSITNLRILPESVLALPTRGAINFHDGPLPRYAGLHAPAWALIDGEERFGITWHLIDGVVDGGPVLEQAFFEIEGDETAFTLNAKCFEAGYEAFLDLIPRLAERSLGGVPQDLTARTFVDGLARPSAGGVIDWDTPAADVLRLVRGLDFGPGYANPLTVPKVVVAGAAVTFGRAELVQAPATASPGTVVAVEAAALVVASLDADIRLHDLLSLDGSPVELVSAVVPGDSVGISEAERVAVSTTMEGLVRNEQFWGRKLAGAAPVELPGVSRQAWTSPRPASFDAEFASGGQQALAAELLTFFTRYAAADELTIGLGSDTGEEAAASSLGIASAVVPLHLVVDHAAPAREAHSAAGVALAEALGHGSFPRDLRLRRPELRERAWGSVMPPIGIRLSGDTAKARVAEARDLEVVIGADGAATRWLYDAACIDQASVARLVERFAAFRSRLASGSAMPFAQLSVLDRDDEQMLFADEESTWARVEHVCVHTLVERQVDRTPDAVALVDGERSFTYRELDEAANGIAESLRLAGVVRGARVGILADRSAEMVLAALGTWKAGAAYLPLDPTYPTERVEHMMSDGGCSAILTTVSHVPRVEGRGVPLIRLDEAGTLQPTSRAPSGAEPDDLAYVIYTSGSTGLPKGVMVEHRNVVNFFVGMDERVPRVPGSDEAWLAVSSLSFDISVLELFWTLARGVRCILYDDTQTGMRPGRAAAVPGREQETAFSLFYFSSSADTDESERYTLLLEGARFADERGFEAVWTPERHFHAFGGLYPNPAVTGAAVAAITTSIGIRAGSCVLPLHHPARVAEEWAVVDNISGGRVAIAVASGWQPNDFVLAPERYARSKQEMVELLDVVRRLWRGEAVEFPGHDGAPVPIRTLPRPIQPELPTWMTTAGNRETFELAGTLGCNLLTHLLGQTVEEVAAKVDAYRAARRSAGWEGEGVVSLMLHTFLSEDEALARELVREPLKAYLRTAADLIKSFAWSFPTFANTPKDMIGDALATLSDEEMDALLEFSFERYYDGSGLFGTAERAAEMVRRVRGAGVDEIACLIDFGVPVNLVLESLEPLDRLRASFAATAPESLPHRMETPAAHEHEFASLVRRHGVTHLQCTPSQATLLLADKHSAAALDEIPVLLVGGEELPERLAADLIARRGAGKTLLNMYGPTETTIWSATHEVGEGGPVPIGTPIANTSLVVLDRFGEPVPPGVPGELAIGGLGVARGYHARDELTAERFPPDPFSPREGARMYRTGDLVRRRPDGVVEFLGRLDQQVKIRGYRIELGEIEVALCEDPRVQSAVVIARGDELFEKALVGYVVLAGSSAGESDLKEPLRRRLPEFMVPSRIVVLPALPLTPNLKVDRNALPPPDTASAAAIPASAEPTGSVEQVVAQLWRSLLSVDQLGRDDNFFDLGGHSLLVVEAHRRLVAELEVDFPLTDLFRFTTIASLARRLELVREPGLDAEAIPGDGRERAAQRRAAMTARRRARRGSPD